MTDVIETLAERIRAGYAAEAQDAHLVTSLTELPHTYDHLTEAWLTELLGAPVASFRAEDADDLGRGHARIWLTYTDPDTNPRRPESVFCKDSQRLELRVFNAFLVEGEVQFYREIQRELGVETPECLFAGFDPRSYNSLLIFSDLREHDLGFCTEQTVVTRAVAESQLRHIARVHGRFAAEMDSNPLMANLRTFQQVYERVGLLFGGQFGAAVQRGLQVAESVVPKAVLAREIWPAVQGAFARQASAPPTLTHNDSHIDNWYPTPAGELRLGDWQLVSRNDPAFDLALIISTSPTIDDRRAWERELLELYCDELAAAGGPRLQRDALWERYRAQLPAVLAWWTPTLARSVDFDFHDHEGTLTIIQRITTAIDDLDALDLYAGDRHV